MVQIAIFLLLLFQQLDGTKKFISERKLDEDYAVAGEESDLESLMMKDLKKWIDDIIYGSVPKHCYGTNEEFKIRKEEYLVRHAPCHEKDAIRG